MESNHIERVNLTQKVTYFEVSDTKGKNGSLIASNTNQEISQIFNKEDSKKTWREIVYSWNIIPGHVNI